jgi:hypothetical protein
MSVFRRFPRSRPGSAPVVSRVHAWRTLRAEHLRSEPQCAACGSRSRLVVHHIVPVHIDRARELDVSNLITLCEGYEYGVNCHLYHGHGGRWERWNPQVREQAASALRWLTMHIVR